MSKEINLVDNHIKFFVHLQNVICQKIANKQKLMNENVFHYLMLINKELETLAYCRKILSTESGSPAMIDRNVLFSQIKDSIRRLKKWHAAIIEIFYNL